MKNVCHRLFQASSCVVFACLAACANQPPERDNTSAASGPAASTAASREAAGPDAAAPKYEFSSDWHVNREELWTRILAPYKGKPDLHYLEVGVFEGRSVIWMLENVLTHPSARVTGLDIFGDGLEELFWRNVRASGAADKVTAIKGRSQLTLRELPLDSFDVIYIDGSHRARDVLQDLTLSWDLLKEGGLMIMDDFQWEPDWPPASRPNMAINAFLNTFGGALDIVHKRRQVVIRKIPEICAGEDAWECVELPPYIYLRRQERLIEVASGEELELSEAEKQLVNEIARQRRFGIKGVVIPEPLRRTPEFQAFSERLAPGTWQ